METEEKSTALVMNSSHNITLRSLQADNSSIFIPANDSLSQIGSTSTSQPSWMPTSSPTISLMPSLEPSGMPSSAPTEFLDRFINSNDAQIIRETFRLYGSLYLIFFLSFCVLRKKMPKYFNIRSWVPEIKTSLATNAEYGFFSWAWKVFSVSDDDLLETCGMDAICFLRCLRLGTKFTLVGTLNSLWLIPLYLSADSSPETDLLTDPFVLMSVANLPPGSVRYTGTIIAAYITILSSLYLILKEYNWYAEYRHKYLSQREPRNYSVYVSGIPEEYRSSYALADYFRQCISWKDAVYEAHIAMDIPSLEAKVARRDHLVERMEHTAALERKHGVKQTHRTLKTLIQGKGMTRVDSSQTFKEELINLNSSIALEVGHITRSNHRMRQHLTRFQTSPRLNLIEDDEDDEDAQSEADRRRLPKAGSEPTLASRDTDTTAFSSMRGFDRATSSPNMEYFSDIEEGSHPAEDELVIKGDSLNPSTSEESKFASATEPSTDDSVWRQRQEMGSSAADSNENDQSSHPFLAMFGISQELFRPSSFDALNSIDTESEQVHNAADADSMLQGTPQSLHNHDLLQMIDPEAADLPFEESNEEEDYGDIGQGSFDLTRLGVIGAIPELRDDISSSSTISNSDKKKSLSRGSSGSKSSSSWMIGDTIRSKSSNVSIGVKSSFRRVSESTVNVGDHVLRASKIGASKVKAAGSMAGLGVKKAAELGLSKIQQAPDLGKTVGASLAVSAAAVVPLRFGRAEGKPLEAGFVVFRDLYTTQAALQMLQHHDSSCMLVEPAPDSEEIFWRNVGLPAQSRRSGWMLSMFATSILCLFWSIPMAFFSSLTEVNSLKQNLPRLGELLEEFPALESFLALVAPLLLLLMNEVLLPVILKYFATWEGHVGASLLEASLFVKLCAFVIIQTFFVSALSGTITAELANFLEDPEGIVDLLANSLPAQSSYFIQICFVFTFLLQGLDLVRAYPLGMAILRRYFFGRNLTPKERRKTWGMIHSLEDPPEFWHAELLAQIMLFFVVFFVYSTIAPITSPFLLTCFLILESGYRYHFIHNQKPKPDSGGKLWTGFIHVLIASQLIGQCTLFGLLVLKRTVYALPALLPCVMATILFAIFVVPRRNHVALYLPTLKCAAVDKESQERGDHVKNFACKAYLQPALKSRPVYPEGFEMPRVRIRTMSRDGTR